MEKLLSVLIVDDDTNICLMLKDALRHAGYHCDAVTSGDAALERIGQGAFDVVVTDIMMPGMNGLELTRRSKQIKPELPVIVMTAFSEEDSSDKAIAAGASDFITKPFRVNELLIRMDRIRRDASMLHEIRKREHELCCLSREMIEGVQSESLRRITALETEIAALKKCLSRNG